MIKIMLADSGFKNFIYETIKACKELAITDKTEDNNWSNCAENLEDFIGNMPYDHDDNGWYGDFNDG